MTVIDNIIPEFDTILHYHYTFERVFTSTVDDEFHSSSFILDIHRVGEPALSSLTLPPSPSSPLARPPPTHRSPDRDCCRPGRTWSIRVFGSFFFSPPAVIERRASGHCTRSRHCFHTNRTVASNVGTQPPPASRNPLSWSEERGPLLFDPPSPVSPARPDGPQTSAFHAPFLGRTRVRSSRGCLRWAHTQGPPCDRGWLGRCENGHQRSLFGLRVVVVLWFSCSLVRCVPSRLGVFLEGERRERASQRR